MTFPALAVYPFSQLHYQPLLWDPQFLIVEKGIRDMVWALEDATASFGPFSRQSWEAGVCADMTTRCPDGSMLASVHARSLTLLASSPLAAVLDLCVVGGS